MEGYYLVIVRVIILLYYIVILFLIQNFFGARLYQHEVYVIYQKIIQKKYYNLAINKYFIDRENMRNIFIKLICNIF